MAIPIYNNFYQFKENLEADEILYPDYVQEAKKTYSELVELYSRYATGITFNQFKDLAKNANFAENWFLKQMNIEFGKPILNIHFEDKAAEITNNVIISRLQRSETATEISAIFQYLQTLKTKKTKEEFSGAKRARILYKIGFQGFLTNSGYSITQAQKLIADITNCNERTVRDEVKKDSVNDLFADEYLSNLKTYSRS